MPSERPLRPVRTGGRSLNSAAGSRGSARRSADWPLVRLARQVPDGRTERAFDEGCRALHGAQAETAVRRSIALAPKLGSAYQVLGAIEADRLNFANARQYNERATTLSPDDLGVLLSASFFKVSFGDARDGLRFADRAIALDPLSTAGYLRRAEALTTLRRYPQSIIALRRALEIAPKLTTAHSRIGEALIMMGQYARAKAEYQLLPADDVFRTVGEGIVAARTGDRAGAEQAISRIKEQYGPSASYQYAQIYAQLGDTDRAFEELDNAVEVKDPGLTILKPDAFLDPIRRDPRYAALLLRLRVP